MALKEDGKINISRRKVLQTTGAAVVGTVPFTGTASANCPCETVKLGKIEGGKLPACGESTTVTLTLEGDQRIADDPACQDDKDVDVEVTATDCKDGGSEVTCVELKIVDDNGACKCADDGLYLSGARVKGGPDHAEYDCGDVESNNQDYSKLPDACAPVGNNGKRHGISHIDVLVCVFPKDKQTGDDCAGGGGG